MNARAKYKLKGFLFMFLSSSLMGGIGAFGRYINAPGDFISFGRNFLGLIALSLIFIFIGGFKLVKQTKLSGSMVFSGIFLGLLSGLYVIGTQYTTLANASFLIYTGPVWSTILATIFLKEPFNKSMFACLASVIIGMLFIVGIITPEGITLDLDPKYTYGNFIAFLSGVAYGLYLFVSRYRQDCDSKVRAWWNFLFAAVTILVLMIVRGIQGQLQYTVKAGGVPVLDNAGQIVSANWNIFTMDSTSWMVWIAAALITGFGAFFLLAFATKMLKAGELAAISYQETIMASVLGLIMFHEIMTIFQIIGGALIIIGGVSQIMITTKKENANKDYAFQAAGAGASGYPDTAPEGLSLEELEACKGEAYLGEEELEKVTDTSSKK